MRGSSDSESRFSSSSPPPNAFLTPAFTAIASTDGSISNSPLNIDLSLLRFTRSRHNRLRFSSSSSSNEFRSTRSPLSPIENLELVPEKSSPSYPVYANSRKVDVGEDLMVVDALDQSSLNTNLFIKTEICRSWEERGFCRFGYRCQFAHGKEELRGSARFSNLKPEVDFQTERKSGKQISTVGSTAPTLLSKPANPKMKIIKPEIEPPVQPEPAPVFSWPPTESDAVEIDRALYGPSQTGRRLPVFLQISPPRSNSPID